MVLSNFSLVLASWTLTCSGFVVMTAPIHGQQDAACGSAFSGPGRGLSFRPAREVVWLSGLPSRLPRRRRHFNRIALGAADRAAGGGPGGVDGLKGAALERVLSKGTDGEQSGDVATTPGQLPTPPTAGNGKSNSKNALMAQMVKAAGQRQHWREAIVMFDQMQEEGVPPVKAAYAAALRACAKGAEWERGTQLLDNYLEEGYALDDGVVQAAVKACCRAGRPSEAEAVLVKSLERGLVPEVSLFTAVMNACYTVGDMDAILSLGEQLRAQSLTPDAAAYHLMVTSHISKLDWVRATEALVEMGRAGLAPSGGSARKWRLASAAIEEIDIDVDEDSYNNYNNYNMLTEEAGMALGDEDGGGGSGAGSRWDDGGERDDVFTEGGEEEEQR